MDLKSRMNYMIHSAMDHGVSIDQLLKEIKITKRTFYYDLEKINEWLSYYSLGEAIIDDKTLLIQTSERYQLLKKIDKNSDLLLSIEERQAMELLIITISPSVTTIRVLQEFFDVSKNTILTDIKEWKLRLDVLSLQMFSTIKKGYFLEGDELIIRKLIWQQIQILGASNSKNLIYELLQSSLTTLTTNDIDFIELSRCIIRQYENDTKTRLVLSDTNYESMMILVSLVRVFIGYPIVMDEFEKATIEETSEYIALNESIEKIREINFEVPIHEVHFITTLFLGIKRFKFDSSILESNHD